MDAAAGDAIHGFPPMETEMHRHPGVVAGISEGAVHGLAIDDGDIAGRTDQGHSVIQTVGATFQG